MAEPEQKLTLESSGTATSSSEPTPVPPFTRLLSAAKDTTHATFEAVNMVPAKKITGTVQLPALPESDETGYRGGRSNPFTVRCCSIGTKKLEKNTAYDFILMSNAAAADGVTLSITEGFREMATQERFWAERANKAIAKKKGVAAEPGWSNHQQGTAVDIYVGMEPEDYLAKRFTNTYLWLEKNAGGYGFDHVEGDEVSEAWHWTHLKPEICGKSAFTQKTGFLVQITETAVAATSEASSGVQISAIKEIHDLTVGYSRADAMQSTSRATFGQEHALFLANQSNGILNKVGQGQAATLEVMPKGFDSTTLAALSYDFETGLWKDNQPV